MYAQTSGCSVYLFQGTEFKIISTRTGKAIHEAVALLPPNNLNETESPQKKESLIVFLELNQIVFSASIRYIVFIFRRVSTVNI